MHYAFTMLKQPRYLDESFQKPDLDGSIKKAPTKNFNTFNSDYRRINFFFAETLNIERTEESFSCPLCSEINFFRKYFLFLYFSALIIVPIILLLCQ